MVAGVDVRVLLEQSHGVYAYMLALSVCALRLACCFSAGSASTGLPGVVYAWLRVGWEGPVG